MPDSGYRTAIDPLPACDGVRKPIDPMLSATAGPARSAPVTGTSTRHGRMMQGSGSMELHRTPSRRAARRPAAWLLCLVYALQSGCSTLPLHKPQTGHQTGLGRVAIVSPDREPEVKFQGLIGKATGAGGTFKTAWEPSGAAAAAAVKSAVPSFCSCWAFAASRGGIAGAVASPGAETVRAAEAQRAELTAAVAARTIQDTLRERVTEWAPALFSPASGCPPFGIFLPVRDALTPAWFNALKDSVAPQAFQSLSMQALVGRDIRVSAGTGDKCRRSPSPPAGSRCGRSSRDWCSTESRAGAC
jgi:hypothetical protein